MRARRQGRFQGVRCVQAAGLGCSSRNGQATHQPVLLKQRHPAPLGGIQFALRLGHKRQDRVLVGQQAQRGIAAP